MGSCGSKGPGVTKYKGFQEHAYRLLFPYEANFPDAEPDLLTILPTGVIETTKKLIPEAERGLIAYTFAQQIDKKLLEGKVVDTEHESVWKGKKHADTPFIKDIPGPKYTLIQTWPTKINEKFKEDFKMEHNPDIKKFESGAVADWKNVMEALFGKGATEKVKIQFCHKTTENKFPCYVGVTEDLLLYFKDNNAEMIGVGIKNMTEKGFVATGEDGKGTKVEKAFTMDAKTKYVIYKKQGWETMGCCKTKEQFDKECDFMGQGEWLAIGQPS